MMESHSQIEHNFISRVVSVSKYWISNQIALKISARLAWNIHQKSNYPLQFSLRYKIVLLQQIEYPLQLNRISYHGDMNDLIDMEKNIVSTRDGKQIQRNERMIHVGNTKTLHLFIEQSSSFPQRRVSYYKIND